MFVIYLIGVLVGLTSYLFALSHEAMENNLTQEEYQDLYKKTIIPALLISLIPFGGFILAGLFLHKILFKGGRR